MKKKFIKIFALFTVLIIILAAIIIIVIENEIKDKDNSLLNAIVAVSEIEHITTVDGVSPVQTQIDELKNILRQNNNSYVQEMIIKTTAIFVVFSFIAMLTFALLLFVQILSPFSKLEKYADQLAKGDFDIALKYERSNFFGAFTWAFDHMRKEIIAAREKEEKAIADNKTIIATLSHDIKTPIASISAYAEALEANIDSEYEQRLRYLSVIMRKCDEVTRLTNDLVSHSLSELNKLEITTKQIEIDKFLINVMNDLEYSHLNIIEPIPHAILQLDEKRTAQIIENLLANARKYAPDTTIDVWCKLEKDSYSIHIRDHGNGIPGEDMPFIFEKFYRGKNVGDKSGSGLGLFIVKYIVEKMNGNISLINHSDGLEAVVAFSVNISEKV